MTSTGAKLTLAFETSNPSFPFRGDLSGSRAVDAGTISLGWVVPGSGEPRLLGMERLILRGRHDDVLVPSMDLLCRRCGVLPGDIERVAVSIGPGGFTALRVAVTTAKLLSESVGAETIPVPTSLVAALRYKAVGRFAVALASKRESAWFTFFDRSGADWVGASGAGRIMDAEELRVSHGDSPISAVLADGHLPGRIRGWADEVGVPIRRLRLCATRCLQASAWCAPVDPLELAPLYPREPEAVRMWRELGKTPGPVDPPGV